MVDSIEDLSSNDIQEKYTTYSNTLKKLCQKAKSPKIFLCLPKILHCSLKRI